MGFLRFCLCRSKKSRQTSFQECINAVYLSTKNDLGVSTCLSSNLASLLEGYYLYCDIYNRAPCPDPFRDLVPDSSRTYHLCSWPFPFVCLFRLSYRDPDLVACHLWNATGNEFGCGNVSASSGGGGGDYGDATCVACPCPAYQKGSWTETGEDFPPIWNSFSLSSRDSFLHL